MDSTYDRQMAQAALNPHWDEVERKKRELTDCTTLYDDAELQFGSIDGDTYAYVRAVNGSREKAVVMGKVGGRRLDSGPLQEQQVMEHFGVDDAEIDWLE